MILENRIFFLLDSIRKIFETPSIDKTAPGKPAPEPKSIMLPFKFLQKTYN